MGGFGSPPKMEVMRRMKVDFPHPESAASPITTVLLLTCTTAGRTEAWLPERCTDATSFGCTRVKEDAPWRIRETIESRVSCLTSEILAWHGSFTGCTRRHGLVVTAGQKPTLKAPPRRAALLVVFIALVLHVSEQIRSVRIAGRPHRRVEGCLVSLAASFVLSVVAQTVPFALLRPSSRVFFRSIPLRSVGGTSTCTFRCVRSRRLATQSTRVLFPRRGLLFFSPLGPYLRHPRSFPSAFASSSVRLLPSLPPPSLSCAFRGRGGAPRVRRRRHVASFRVRSSSTRTDGHVRGFVSFRLGFDRDVDRGRRTAGKGTRPDRKGKPSQRNPKRIGRGFRSRPPPSVRAKRIPAVT